MPESIWDRIGEALHDWWWAGHSSTHHNPEMPDVERMKRTVKALRTHGRADLADNLQTIIDREEKTS